MEHENSDFLAEPGSTVVDDEAAYAAAAAENPSPQDPGHGEGGQQAQEPIQGQSQEGAQQAGEAQTPGAQADGKPDKYVPLEALHEARHETREVREQLRQVSERLNQFAGLREQLEEMRRQRSEADRQAQEAAAQEEYANDPIGFMRKQVDTLQSKITQQEQEQHQTQEQMQAQQAHQRQVAEFQRQMTEQIAAFSQTTPDYPDAVKYLMDARVAELNAVGITNPADVSRAIDQEAFSLMLVAAQQGKNPGEAAYNLARAKGYTPSAPAPAAGEGEQQQPANSLAEQLDKLERGQRAAQSLSGGGANPKGDLSLQDIKDMPDAEFDALWAEMAREANSGDIFDG